MKSTGVKTLTAKDARSLRCVYCSEMDNEIQRVNISIIRAALNRRQYVTIRFKTNATYHYFKTELIQKGYYVDPAIRGLKITVSWEA